MRANSKILIALNIIILVLLAWLLLRDRYARVLRPAVNASDGFNYSFNRDLLFEALPKDSNAIIFLGNSHTNNFELAELFHNADIKNRGITGDGTAGVLNRLKPIVACQARKIFIEIGTNDVLAGMRKDSILHNYRLILETLRTQCPQTKVYVQSILPVSNNSEMLKHYDTEKINETIRALNEKLKAYAGQKNNGYIDLYSKFETNKGLAEQYTTDGVHLSAAGYLLWTGILKPYITD